MTSTSMFYRACNSCGFWKQRLLDTVGLDQCTLPFSVDFNPHKEAPSLMYLASSIHERPELLHTMDPGRFELFVGSVLKEVYDCEVWHVGRSGDDGVDLVVVEKDEPLLVQVKRRQNPDAVEGIEVVKLLFASAFARGADRGMVVTTAQRFSRVAKKWVHLPRLQDVKFQLELVDVNKLLHMLHLARPPGSEEPWQMHFASNRHSYQQKNKCEWSCVTILDGLIVLRHTHTNTISYVFDGARPGKCYEVMSDRVPSPSQSVKEASAMQYVKLRCDAGDSVMHLEGDSLLSALAQFDKEVVKKIGTVWWHHDSSLVVNLMDFYG